MSVNINVTYERRVILVPTVLVQFNAIVKSATLLLQIRSVLIIL